MISFEGGWCASNADGWVEFAVSWSIGKAAASRRTPKKLRYRPQTCRDSAYFLDRADVSLLSSMATHRRRLPRHRMPASSRDDGARQVIRPGLATQYARSAVHRAANPPCLPTGAIRGPLHTLAISTGADAGLLRASPVSSCEPRLPAGY